jgi:2-keto-4-pentenoate hydratase/2-oxohepta-3-ene-1,7-dioic acid hydratase in catechol pathway
MKLARFSVNGDVRLGIVRGDRVVDLSTADPALPRDWMSIISGSEKVLDRLTRVKHRQQTDYDLVAVHLLSPIPKPAKYLAIGLNYAAHIREARPADFVPPAHQYWFNKQTSCVAGPYDDIIKPTVSEMLDYEVELGVVIGRAARSVPVEKALEHVFGYLVCNDVSVRDWQKHAPSLTMGKSFDTHGPIGPWIVTADEIPDPQMLDLRCLVNGETRQSSNTRNMMAKVADQIAYLSVACTLEPGDLIATGTPEGVGIGMKPPQFLKIGDVVRCEIENIGHIENRVAAPHR